VVLQRSSVQEADHLDATAAATFPPPRRRCEPTTTPPTRRRKSIEGAEDLDATAAPTFAQSRRRREPRVGRHGRAAPLPSAGGLDATPGRRLVSLPGRLLLRASVGGDARDGRAVPRPPPRSAPAPFPPTPPGTTQLGFVQEISCLRRNGYKMQKHPHKSIDTCLYPYPEEASMRNYFLTLQRRYSASFRSNFTWYSRSWLWSTRDP
jgi:hypothetical protein